MSELDEDEVPLLAQIKDDTNLSELNTMEIKRKSKDDHKLNATISNKMLFNKLFAALWKCWRIRIRHYMLTLFVIFIPILLYGLLAWARTKLGHISKQYVNETTYIEPMSEDLLYLHYKVDVSNTYLLYAPATKFTDELMREVQLKMEITNHKFYGFNTEIDLLAFYNQNVTENSVYAVVFDNLETDDVPTTLKYSIRNFEKNLDWHTDFKFNIMAMQYIPGTGSELYFHKAFINLQLAIDKTFLQLKRGNLDFDFSMQEFPYPPHSDDIGFTDMFMNMLPLVTMISTVFIFPGTLKRMMEEKDSGIKELTKMMGLPPSIMYLGWFIDAFCPVIVSAVICTVLMKNTWGTAYAPIEYCNGVIYAIFLLLYFSSCIAFCLCVASLSDSPAFTTSISIVIWIITYIVPYGVKNLSNLGFAVNIILFFIPNFAMNSGFHSIALYEILGTGVQWNNLFSTANGSISAVPLGYSLIMLLIDIILLLAFGFYVDQIRPGKYGLPKPWNYPFIGWFKKGMTKMKRKNSVSEYSDDDTSAAKIEQCGGNAGVTIKNLTKAYGDKIAVDNMSVKFFEGEIAVLLGRNGAGKTTTMSVLTGMTDATRGEVWINDYDIRENLNYVRSVMGMCPQHDLLFPELTVSEHVMFFAKLHNVRNPTEKVRRLLMSLNLYDKRNMLPQGISGGMKRKLCLALAIISNPSILILDEPTSGLDPKSRRELWDLILAWRSENPKATILVSTHFMEEADVLGDRITIMESGHLVAQGTPMYLKNEFANECHLTLILKDQSYRERLYADCQTVLGDNFSIIPRQESLKIITKNNNKAALIELMQRIENGEYVTHMGISTPSIEDVFLKLASVSSLELVSKDKTQKPSHATIDIEDNNSLEGRNSGTSTRSEYLAKQVDFARYGGIKYQWKRYLPYLLMSIGMILLLRFAGSTQSVNQVTRPALPLQLDAYGKTVVYYSIDSSITTNFAKELEKVVNGQGSQAIRVDSVSDALIEMGLKSLDDYKRKAVVALEFNATSDNKVLLNMMYSNSALHGAPIALNLATTVLANILTGGSIIATNNPLKSNDDVVLDELASEIQIVLLWIILAPIALMFLVASYINYPLKERITNFKHLIYMSGVNPMRYWLWMFFFHYVVLYLFPAVLICGILISNELYYDGAVPLLLVLLWYGAMMIPFVFIFSYKNSVAAAVGTLTSITIFTGLVCPFVIVILQNCGDEFYEKLGHVAHGIALVSPQYWLTNCLITFTRKSVWLYKWDQMLPTQQEILCKVNYNPCCVGGSAEACKAYKSYYKDGLDPLIYLLAVPLIMIALYFSVLWILDSYKLQRILKAIFCRTTHFKNVCLCHKNQRDWTRLTNESSTFHATDLRKRFSNKNVVDNLSFSVKPGQCYGLLGVNGAGKTTTFKMLTGYEVPTSGSAEIKFSSGTMDMQDWETSDKYFQKIGYCPQFNAINEVLPARTLLKLFAGYRGVPDDKQDFEVQKMISRIGLDEFADVPCGTLSGGNKRKLCLGISLIGKTSVAFLDEPTTGVDPVSRRKIWDVLAEVKGEAMQPLVLTSHSMDECEKLCDFLAIMKKGKVHTQGSINELKLKYGQGLTIKIKLRPVMTDVDEIDGPGLDIVDAKHILALIQSEVCGRVDLKDQHEKLLHYFIPEMRCGVGDLRRFLVAMEELKQRANSPVEDYTISTSSLEDVFLSVANEEAEA